MVGGGRRPSQEGEGEAREAVGPAGVHQRPNMGAGGEGAGGSSSH